VSLQWVILAHEHDSAATIGLGPNAVARLQASREHRRFRDGDLVLAADLCPAAPTLLYFLLHE
jgi:hypothetical protein